MYRTFNAARKQRKHGEFRCKLEEQVNQSLTEQGLAISYEKERFPYHLKKYYTPDFLVKGERFDFWIEVKGYWPSDARTKFLAVIREHPTLPIFVALQKPTQKLSRSSSTSYSQWCEKFGICWCPTPIPQEFLLSWVHGQRTTYHAQAATSRARAKSNRVAAQTELPVVGTEASTASAATTTSKSQSPKMESLETS